jgi:hypothetical protein
MTFNQYELTQHSGEPVSLYEFQMGANTLRHTRAELPITVASVVYEPTNIQHSDITQSTESARNEVTITVDYDHPVAQYLLRYIPTIEIAARILAFQRQDTDEEVVREWNGIVVDYKYKYPECELICKPADYELNRPLLAPVFGPDCQWTQYDPHCGLIPLDWKESGAVLSVDGLVITVNANLGAHPNGHFTGGMVVINGEYGLERAWIINQNSDQLTLDRPLPGMDGGVSIDVVPSCRGDFSRCDTVFANKIKFLGAPHANIVNPYKGDGIRGNQ